LQRVRNLANTARDRHQRSVFRICSLRRVDMSEYRVNMMPIAGTPFSVHVHVGFCPDFTFTG